MDMKLVEKADTLILQTTWSTNANTEINPSNFLHRASNVKQSNITHMNYLHSTHKVSVWENNQTVYKATNLIKGFLTVVI